MSTQTVSSATTASQTTTGTSSSCTTAIPGKYGHVPLDACNSYYNFDPNFGAAVAFAVLFGLATVGHILQAVVHNKRFCWVIIVAGLWETTSFVARFLGAHNQQNVGESIASTILLLTAPLWINAFAYMCIARLAYCFLPEKKLYWLKAGSVSKIFISSDIVLFIVQAIGGMMLSAQGDSNVIKTGFTIYRIGIGIQQLFILLFLALTQRLHARLSTLDRSRVLDRAVKWRPFIWTIYLVLTLISVSSVDLSEKLGGLAEFSRGFGASNPIITNEAYTYGLDALPMLLAVVLFNIFHPGRVLKGPESEFPHLSRKEKKALKQQKKEDKRARKLGGRKGRAEENSRISLRESTGRLEQSDPPANQTGVREDRMSGGIRDV